MVRFDVARDLYAREKNNNTYTKTIRTGGGGRRYTLIIHKFSIII